MQVIDFFLHAGILLLVLFSLFDCGLVLVILFNKEVEFLIR